MTQKFAPARRNVLRLTAMAPLALGGGLMGGLARSSFAQSATATDYKALVGIFLFGLRPPPQAGADEAVLTTMDALFTAVTAHDEKRLTACEERLQKYKDEKKLPAAAWAVLNGIIKQARSGKWQPAAESLYAFIAAQRRGG